MSFYAAPIARLLEELERLPGIGPKSAQRIAFHILRADEAAATRLADAIVEVKHSIHFCSRCFNLAEADLCVSAAMSGRTPRSSTSSRSHERVAISSTGEFRVLYHVLQRRDLADRRCGTGALRVRELIRPIVAGCIVELIWPRSHVEGETTRAVHFALEKPLGVPRHTDRVGVCRRGAILEFADEVTLEGHSRHSGRCRPGVSCYSSPTNRSLAAYHRPHPPRHPCLV